MLEGVIRDGSKSRPVWMDCDLEGCETKPKALLFLRLSRARIRAVQGGAGLRILCFTRGKTREFPDPVG